MHFDNQRGTDWDTFLAEPAMNNLPSFTYILPSFTYAYRASLISPFLPKFWETPTCAWLFKCISAFPPIALLGPLSFTHLTCVRPLRSYAPMLVPRLGRRHYYKSTSPLPNMPKSCTMLRAGGMCHFQWGTMCCTQRKMRGLIHLVP